jgi:hypothetical protein
MKQEHDMNRAGSRPIGSQYDIAPWPVFADVCFTYILDGLYSSSLETAVRFYVC